MNQTGQCSGSSQEIQQLVDARSPLLTLKETECPIKMDMHHGLIYTLPKLPFLGRHSSALHMSFMRHDDFLISSLCSLKTYFCCEALIYFTCRSSNTLYVLEWLMTSRLFMDWEMLGAKLKFFFLQANTSFHLGSSFPEVTLLILTESQQNFTS